MGRACNVPKCNSNHGNQKEYTSVFSFPKEPERRAKWIRSIHREDTWSPGQYSGVCIKHFAEHFIIREDVAKRPDGSVLRVPRKNPVLTKDAYPTIFENQPSYYTSQPPPPRVDPAVRRARLEERNDLEFQQFLQEDKIKSFEDFSKLYTTKLNCEIGDWTAIKHEESFHFLKYNPHCKKVDVVLVVNSDLTVKVFCEGEDVPLKGYSFLGKDFQCDTWMKFTNLFNHFKAWSLSTSTVERKLAFVCGVLKQCVSDINCSVCSETFEGEECGGSCKAKKLLFLHEQLQLLGVNRPSYSPETMIWAFSMFLGHTSAYCDLRDSAVLTLPHPMYLKKFSQQMGPNQSGMNPNHAKYLKEKCKQLQVHEWEVIVMIDEINCRNQLSYKGGRIEGQASNCEEAATSIQTFMLSSLYSKNRDVAALFPVKNQNGDDLICFCKQVLALLEDCGYKVIALISDNHRVNRCLFMALAGGSFEVIVKNPVSPDQDLFLLFDSVHLLKVIRNNWLNQRDADQTFEFPNFNDFKRIERASVKHLKDLYWQEKDRVVKIAPALNQKVLYPSSTERQNVVHAVRLFDEKTIAALHKHVEAEGTKMFLEICLTWWKIVNVKHPSKGIHLRDVYHEPITSTNHASYLFLVKFLEWLNAWNEVKSSRTNKDSRTRPGKLTTDTHTALSHTTKAHLKLIEHLLQKDSVKYVLLGSFQTDKLESRFGKYRQLSGANFHVSVQQILESERKLKFLSLIRLRSFLKREFNLKELLFTCSNSDDLEYPEVDANLKSVIHDADFVDLSSDDLEALVFIGGYVSRGALQNNQCAFCKEFLTVPNKEFEFEGLPYDAGDYLKIIDRGGLIYPNEFPVKICINAFQVFQTLINSEYESLFFSQLSQKQIMIKLIMDRLENANIVLNIQCECGVSMKQLAKKCCSIMTNILLNNYTKVKNDFLSTTKTNKRKLAALNYENNI